MPSRGQRFRASRLRAELPKDLLQCHNAWTEGVAIFVDGPRWEPDQGFGRKTADIDQLRENQPSPARRSI
jgi:hypothetical protein